jgi:phosphatidylinositol-bisphosphatase
LFLEHGDLIVSTYIRECLDKGEQFDTNVLLGGQPSSNGDCDGDDISDAQSALSELTLVSEESKRGKEATSANSMIDVLVVFLECLPDPVISTNMYERALEAAENMDAMNTVSAL